MTIGPQRFLELMRGLTSTSPDVRTNWAAATTDWIRSFDSAEGAAAGVVLLNQALVEDDPDLLEELLHALATLAEWDLVSAEYVRGIDGLDRSKLDPSSLEYVQYLESRLQSTR